MIRVAEKIKRKVEDIFFPVRLHGDIILAETFNFLAKEMNATSIVETGTFLGFSTSLIAERNPHLNVYSCEINKKSFLGAKKRLKYLKNVHLYHGDSKSFLKVLTDKKLHGERPIFFLDAHWGDNWPLEKEIEIISEKIPSCIIFIDDFKVNGNEKFAYDRYRAKECSLDRVNPNLHKKNKYNLFFPNYNSEDCFRKKIPHGGLTGYPIIFQNQSSLFKELKKNVFFKKYFVDKSFLLKPTKR